MNEHPIYKKQPRTPEGLIYGIRPVMEAIAAGKQIEKVYVLTTLASSQSAELLMLCKDHEIPFLKVPLEKLNQFTRANHQGVVATASPIEYTDIEAVIPKLYEDGETPFVLILDRITDVRNFGAIARSAECSGVHAIIIPAKGGAAVNADAMKTSAGALNKIAVCRVDSLMRTVDFLQKSGLQIVACTEKTDTPYYKSKMTGPVAIIMGSEEDGIAENLLKQAALKVSIPMIGEIGSLNVSVAAGIICYEVVRQRGF